MNLADMRYAYIAKEPKCSCVTAIVVDVPGDERQTAKHVQGWIKDGRTVERVDLDAGKLLINRCPHKAVEPVSAQAVLL